MGSLHTFAFFSTLKTGQIFRSTFTLKNATYYSVTYQGLLQQKRPSWREIKPGSGPPPKWKVMINFVFELREMVAPGESVGQRHCRPGGWDNVSAVRDLHSLQNRFHAPEDSAVQT